MKINDRVMFPYTGTEDKKVVQYGYSDDGSVIIRSGELGVVVFIDESRVITYVSQSGKETKYPYMKVQFGSVFYSSFGNTFKQRIIV